MKGSVTTSAVVHAALLLAVLVGLPSPEPFKVEPQDAVQVDISNIGDVTKVMATTKEAVPTPEKPAAQKTEVTKQVKPAPKVAEEEVLAAKPKEPEPEPEPVKKPEPKKAEDKPLDSDPLKELLEEQKLEEEKKVAEEAALAEKKAAEEKKKEADEKKKAEAEKKKKQKLDVAALDALLNKENDERTAPKKSGETDGSPVQGKNEAQGDDAAVAATLIDALRSRLSECWTVPPGAREASITVKVRFNLRKDKSVEGLPIVISGGGDTLSDATAQSAVSAVMECAPYDFLPADRYDMWQEITVNFTPDMMAG